MRRYKVDKETFADVVNVIRPLLESRPSSQSNPISVELKLSMTLRWMAGGHVADIVSQQCKPGFVDQPVRSSAFVSSLIL